MIHDLIQPTDTTGDTAFHPLRDPRNALVLDSQELQPSLFVLDDFCTPKPKVRARQVVTH